MFHVKHPGRLRDFSEALGLHLSDEQEASLVRFEGLLKDRAVAMGMISRGDAGRILERHLLDSLRAAPELPAGSSGYDLGSGAGLPGVVVAASRPELRVTLVERRMRRAAFLELAASELDLRNVEVYAADASGLRERRDFCLARAFAPLPEAWAAASGLLVPGGILVYFAGTRAPRGVGDLPGTRAYREVPCGLLESSGPLVIIARK